MGEGSCYEWEELIILRAIHAELYIQCGFCSFRMWVTKEKLEEGKKCLGCTAIHWDDFRTRKDLDE